MRFRSLRARLLVTSALLVVGLTVATVAYVSMLANRTVDARLREDLERSRKAVAGAETQQFARLQILPRALPRSPSFARCSPPTLRPCATSSAITASATASRGC